MPCQTVVLIPTVDGDDYLNHSETILHVANMYNLLQQNPQDLVDASLTWSGGYRSEFEGMIRMYVENAPTIFLDAIKM